LVGLIDLPDVAQRNRAHKLRPHGEGVAEKNVSRKVVHQSQQRERAVRHIAVQQLPGDTLATDHRFDGAQGTVVRKYILVLHQLPDPIGAEVREAHRVG